jgi:hypothetical protein
MLTAKVARRRRDQPSLFAARNAQAEPMPRMISKDASRQRRRGYIAFACVLTALCHVAIFPAVAIAADKDIDTEEAASSTPNIYLDLSTAYAKVPANTLLLGFRSFASLSTLASQTVTFNAPVTVDVNDKLSLYAGVSGSTTSTALTDWSAATLDSWNAGFTADVIEQQDYMPAVTVQSIVSRTFNSASLGLSATTSSSAVELKYAFDEDETRGVLGGVKFTKVFVNSDLAISGNIAPSIIGYAGAFYQWPDNWKLTGRLGVQSFGGANVGNLIHLPSFTQPILKIDLDKVDDNDNRLFGISLEAAWTPAPVIQFTLRTPIYAVRN